MKFGNFISLLRNLSLTIVMMINNIDRNKYFIEWTHLCNLYNTSIYPMMKDNKYQ